MNNRAAEGGPEAPDGRPSVDGAVWGVGAEGGGQELKRVRICSQISGCTELLANECRCWRMTLPSLPLEVWVPAAHPASSPTDAPARGFRSGAARGQQGADPLRPKSAVYLRTPPSHPASRLRHSCNYCKVILSQMNGFIQTSFFK